MKIYGDRQSGNCYKIQLLVALLKIPHQWIDVDILSGGTQTDEFLRKNPNAKIPLLELDDGRTLSESNAILHFLASSSDELPGIFPDDDYTRAQVLQWQFFEQYSHEPYIAVARFINKYLGLPDDRKADYDAKQEGGHKALSVMEHQLEVQPYLVGNQLTIADISLYAYTHVAHEGSFDLTVYPAIQRWLKRVSSQPNFVSMG